MELKTGVIAAARSTMIAITRSNSSKVKAWEPLAEQLPELDPGWGRGSFIKQQ
jgi:hypothetical protein